MITLIFGPVFFPFIISKVHLCLQSPASEAASQCFILTPSESFRFSQSILRNQTLPSSPLVVGHLKEEKKPVISTIQNQTVLFVPHLDLCVKASNTPARPLKHNFTN